MLHRSCFVIRGHTISSDSGGLDVLCYEEAALTDRFREIKQKNIFDIMLSMIVFSVSVLL